MTKRRGKTGPGGAMAALLMLSLAGCVTSIPSVDVTRFHSEPVPRAGTVSLIPAEVRDAASLEFRTTANAVSAALGRAGFTVLDAGATGAAFEAVIDLRSQTYEAGDRGRSPVSVGVGGSTGSYGGGVGVGIGIDLSGKPKPVIATQLRIQLREAGGGKTVWEGRAETAAKQGSPAAQPGMAAGKLADALFRDYPGASGKTVTIQ